MPRQAMRLVVGLAEDQVFALAVVFELPSAQYRWFRAVGAFRDRVAVWNQCIFHGGGIVAPLGLSAPRASLTCASTTPTPPCVADALFRRGESVVPLARMNDDDLSDLCSTCGAELEDEVPGEARKPCPSCGATARTRRAEFHGSVTVSGSLEARIIRAWDSNSLTLAGVIYAIVVTVVGVVVATLGTLASAIYAVIALVLLGAGLLRFAQPIIAAMRWLLERAKR